MEKCDFGVYLEEDCHKTHFVRKACIKVLCELEEDYRNLLLWRAGLKDSHEAKTICFHHEAKFGSTFPSRFSKCCNIFKVHKKLPKGGHKISLAQARELASYGIESVPGWQLCRRCFTKAKEVSSSETEEYSCMEVDRDSGEDVEELESSLSKEKNRAALNESLESIGASPIKTHSMPKHRRISYANEKINRTFGKMKETFASAIGVEVGEFSSQQEPESVSREFEKKAADLDKLTDEIRVKLQHCDYRHKVQMLTFTPESWSIKYASDYFKVSEYLIRKARELKRKQGINALPEQKTGKVLPEDTLAQVRSFFEDDEYSRLLPGKKDVVSIGRNVHKQKRLLLCNLKELYVCFKEKYPNIRLGFSKFCSLRPKWCITAGASGVHSVCVCSIHQNAILLVDAANTDKTYKDMMDMIVCSRNNNHCMIHRCKDCPGTLPLRSFLEEALSHLEGDISFLQWQSTDHSQLISQTLCSEEFIDLLINSIDKLTSHSYIAKCQASYFSSRKENLDEDSVIVLGDFAENYTFVVQDEIQSFHWSKQYCTLHPAVLY